MSAPLRLSVVLAILGAIVVFPFLALRARAERAPVTESAAAQPFDPAAAGLGLAGAPLVGAAGALTGGASGEPSPAAQAAAAAPRPTPTPAASAARAAAASPPGPTAAPLPRPTPLLARVRAGRAVRVHRRPGRGRGRRLGARTEFGSRQVLGVMAVRDGWLGVASTARADGRLTWVSARSPALEIVPAPVTIEIDLSTRRLALLRGRRVLRRMPVAVGRPGSPTPAGRFSVTDKLRGGRFGAYYGCCILALSGIQPKPPPGWRGGNRLAIHGTNSPGSIGRASSAGCLRGSDRDLRGLMRRVPLGTPVTIKR